MLTHRWRLPQPTPKPFPADFLSAANNSQLLAQLLWQRGIQTPEAVKAFVHLEDYTPTPGTELPDAAIALERMIAAVDGKERILIYGDFDVDGQTGTSIFMLALQALGADVSFYIPDRAAEGHGMNTGALCKLASSLQPKLVVTTDTGITDFNEVSLLNGLGIDTIITDHHELPENLPPSVANVNPRLLADDTHPMYSMCGAGVAFKLCEQLLTHYKQPQSLIDHLLGIAALGTVVDMMPLVKENRWLVWRGCHMLNLKQHVGINALLTISGNDPTETTITSETLGFSIGPRLNALGRLEKADKGVHLLTTTDVDEAANIAAHLEALNRQRQEMCEQTLLEADKAMAAMGGLGDEKAIALASPHWHPGIIGLAATRLKERYQVPVFLMIQGEDDTRCSARSIDGVDMHHILTQFADTFTHFGGHAGAGGFALKNEDYATFKEQLLAYCRNHIADELCQPHVAIDAELTWDQLHPGLVELTDALAPFGQANPSPVYVSPTVVVKAKRALGKEKQHLKLIIAPPKGQASGDVKNIDALAWNTDAETAPGPGDTLQLAFTPGLNTFKGTTTFQMMIKSLKADGAPQREMAPSSAVTSAPAASPHPQSSAVPKVSDTAPLSQSGPIWLDHRQRNQLTPLLAQLMQPSDSSEAHPAVALYTEQPDTPAIPFITPAHIITRQRLRPCTQLVLWDFPPSPQALAAIIARTQPQTIHVVGHATEDTTTPQATTDLTTYLRNAYRHWRAQPAPAFSAAGLASVLGTTPAGAMAVACLFQQAGLVAITPAQGATYTATFTQPAQRPQLDTLLEYAGVQLHWQQQQAFHRFLATASLQELQQHVAAMAQTLPLFSSLESPLAPVTKVGQTAPAPRPEALTGVS